jgi:hypothetical protein
VLGTKSIALSAGEGSKRFSQTAKLWRSGKVPTRLVSVLGAMAESGNNPARKRYLVCDIWVADLSMPRVPSIS